MPAVSRYDDLRLDLAALRRRQALAIFPPTAVTALVAAVSADTAYAALVTGLATLMLLPLALHGLGRLVVPRYRTLTDRASHVSAEMTVLGRRVAGVFGTYRERRKGEQFKQAYDLSGRPLRDLEEALSVGMFRERREVFVTAFMREGVAVRVTASIGSPFRCAAGDDPARWAGHVERLGCDEVRQYHNHPVHTGHTRPSRTDVRTARTLAAILGPHGAKLRSLILCWNGAREWRVFEYDGSGGHQLHFEFDAAMEPRRR
jgi:hypothetical protein